LVKSFIRLIIKLSVDYCNTTKKMTSLVYRYFNLRFEVIVRKSYNMNQNKERYQLRHVYDNLLTDSRNWKLFRGESQIAGRNIAKQVETILVANWLQ